MSATPAPTPPLHSRLVLPSHFTAEGVAQRRVGVVRDRARHLGYLSHGCHVSLSPTAVIAPPPIRRWRGTFPHKGGRGGATRSKTSHGKENGPLAIHWAERIRIATHRNGVDAADRSAGNTGGRPARSSTAWCSFRRPPGLRGSARSLFLSIASRPGDSPCT